MCVDLTRVTLKTGFRGLRTMEFSTFELAVGLHPAVTTTPIAIRCRLSLHHATLTRRTRGGQHCYSAQFLFARPNLFAVEPSFAPVPYLYIYLLKTLIANPSYRSYIYLLYLYLYADAP